MAKVTARKETGRLVIDFTYRGVRCREQTALADTVANRKRVESMLAKLKAALASGTFVYREFFPGSPLAERFEAPAPAPAPGPGTPLPPAAAASAAASTTPSFKDSTATWLAEHQIEWRRSHLKVLNCTLGGHLLPHFGERPVGSITKADIFAFRAKLSELPGRTQQKMSNKRINGILAPLRPNSQRGSRPIWLRVANRDVETSPYPEDRRRTVHPGRGSADPRDRAS